MAPCLQAAMTARKGDQYRKVVLRGAQRLEADAAGPEGQLAWPQSLPHSRRRGALPGVHPNPGTGCSFDNGVDTNASTGAARVLESTMSILLPTVRPESVGRHRSSAAVT